METTPAAQPAAKRLNRGKLVGNYFIALGFLQIVAMIGASISGGTPQLDIMPVVLIWVGFGLRRLNRSLRLGAILICVFYDLLAIGGMAWLLCDGIPAATPYHFAIPDSPSPWTLLALLSLTFILFASPLVVLLLPRTRDQFLHPRSAA